MPADPPSPDTTSVIQAAIKDAAPRLAAALTGPDAAIALAALGRVLVGDAMATPEQIAAALHTADRAAIQAAEQDTLGRLRKAGATLDLQAKVLAASPDLTVAAPADTENARLFQIQTHDSHHALSGDGRVSGVWAEPVGTDRRRIRRQGDR